MSLRGIAFIFVALLTPTVANAGPMQIAWSLRSPTNTIALPEGVSGGFSFPNTVFEPGNEGGGVVATSVAAYSLATADAPDRVTDLPYEFGVELRDDASGEITRFTFTGRLSGTLWRTGTDLNNSFTGPTSQTAELGGHKYKVELDGFTSPTGYGDSAAGGIMARVSVLEPSDDTPIIETPEPGTLALGGVALGMGGATFVRRFLRRGRPVVTIPSAVATC